MKYLAWLVVLLAVLDTSFAYTAKKREQRRPAFNAASVTQHQKDAQSQSAPSTASNTAAFAFAPAVAYTYSSAHHDDSLDDEELIGYGTALFTCFLSLALGFGLGYGT